MGSGCLSVCRCAAATGFQALGAAERSQLTRLLPLLCEVGQALLDNLLNRFTQEVQSTEARM